MTKKTQAVTRATRLIPKMVYLNLDTSYSKQDPFWLQSSCQMRQHWSTRRPTITGIGKLTEIKIINISSAQPMRLRKEKKQTFLPGEESFFLDKLQVKAYRVVQVILAFLFFPRIMILMNSNDSMKELQHKLCLLDSIGLINLNNHKYTGTCLACITLFLILLQNAKKVITKKLLCYAQLVNCKYIS